MPERTTMAVETPRKLLVHQLNDLYSAEHPILKALPRVVKVEPPSADAR